MSTAELPGFLGALVVVSILLTYLKNANPALFGAVLAGTSAVLTLFIMGETEQLISSLGGYMPEFGGEGFSAVIKGIYISVSSEIVSSLCRDNGLSSIAIKAEIAARVALVSLALPLVAQLFSLLEAL